MCGIAGIFSLSSLAEEDYHCVRKMNDLQKHRGPDDHGVYCHPVCALGHRRLAILDLSRLGHQPYSSDDSRYHLVYNGEIYNYLELRAELERDFNWVFKSQTDTEVLLAMYVIHGSACLSKLNGMFSFAVFDVQEKRLFLARDRFGIKPLYYMFHHGKFIFCSEIKAFSAIPGLKHSINPQALFDYLVFNRTDVGDNTFFDNIKRFPKGSFGVCSTNLTIDRWWSAENYLTDDVEIDFSEVCLAIEQKFVDSVKLRMRSDVEVGSCLSGGLDSSIITGVLYHQGLASDKYKTFTASFPGDPIDETPFVDALKNRYPFVNYRTYPKHKQAIDDIRDFVYYNDEPTNSPSFYTQYKVMALAHQNNIKVLLDGQGGDEIFAGYQYFHGFYQYGLIRQNEFGTFLKELSKTVVRKQHKSSYQTLLFQLAGDSIRKQLLRRMVPYIKDEFFHDLIDSSVIYKEFFRAGGLNESLVRHLDYKLEHLLRIEDRNSMRFSIEARVPYLDFNLVEFVIGLPEALKISGGHTKRLQKEALGSYTIDKILHRKDKIGFGTPSGQWMRSREWEHEALRSHGILKESFPEVFTNSKSLPHSNHTRWKVCQLGVWKEIFLD
jgi:asparagine synthase (glutamine-hydrolysing)